jgi:hypothetical protein
MKAEHLRMKQDSTIHDTTMTSITTTLLELRQRHDNLLELIVQPMQQLGITICITMTQPQLPIFGQTSE